MNDYDNIFPMCFVNNYTGFVLSVIDMAFRGLHDANPLDPSILVLQDKHMSHLVDDRPKAWCIYMYAYVRKCTHRLK